MQFNKLNFGRLLAGSLLLSALSSVASADFTLTGNFTYRDRAFTYSGGFNGNEPARPIRFANVQVLDNSTGSLIVAGATDDNGDLSIVVPGSGNRDIIVTVLSRSITYSGRRIRCVTTSNVLYSVSSAVFSSWDQNTDLDVGAITSEIITSGGQEANPFNMLDMGVFAVDYIASVGSPVLNSSVDIEWPGGSGSFASGTRANIATDDGFDDMVILHELGHVFHNIYSDSDNTGGSHFFGDSDQDPRLSYGEGWATYFGSAVRQHSGYNQPGFYMDANSNGSTGPGTIGLRMQLENAAPYAGSTGGEATEVGVACVLWDIVDTVDTKDGNTVDDDDFDGSLFFAGGISGDQMIWNAFIGPAASALSVTINDHWNGFFNPVDYGNYNELRDTFDDWDILNFHDPEEPNNTFATASPSTFGTNWSPIKSLYYSGSTPPAPGDNDQDYYSFSLANGDQFDVETRYPNGNSNAHTYADTFLTVYRPDGSFFASNTDSGQGRNASLFNQIADQSGDWRASVSTNHSYRETGSYQVKIVRSGISIASVSPTSIDCLSPTAQPLTLTGFGFTNLDSLKYDGVTLTPGAGGLGQYTVINDGEITILDAPQASKLGAVDIEAATTGVSSTIQIQVDPIALPLMKTDSTVVFQSTGFDLIVGSGLLDLVWVNASTSLVPTSYPGILELGIGNNG
ncbi:MAG: hypothetical protein ACI8TQ_003875, partial [Planctomycetota bacterium]